MIRDLSIRSKARSQALTACVRPLAGIVAAALLGGCSLPYYWQAVTGQVSLLSRRVPIEAVIEDSADGRADPGRRCARCSRCAGSP